MTELIFAESKPLEPIKINMERWKVLIVDDEVEVHTVTKMAMASFEYEDKRLEFISAFSGQEAMDIMREPNDISVLFMDVIMEENDAGLKAIKYIREVLNNKFVRIILRTGQPGSAPESRVMAQYDINDYKEKSELTTLKLYTTMIGALRSYNDIMLLDKVSKELEIAKNRAESESRAKSLFLGNVSHEIRTPLNGILLSIELLRDTTFYNEYKKTFDMIDLSANLLIRNIDDLITISQLESGRIELKENEFNIYNLCRSIIEKYKVSAEAKHLGFEFEIDKEIPEYLYGDQGLLKCILVNIVSNSIKFTERGMITLKIEREYLNDKNIRIRVKLHDTGIGIAEDSIEKIFEPLTQEDNSNSRRYQGLGLGLSISKRMLELMGGDIVIDSIKGGGTTVTFYVNLKLV